MRHTNTQTNVHVCVYMHVYVCVCMRVYVYVCERGTIDSHHRRHGHGHATSPGVSISAPPSVWHDSFNRASFQIKHSYCGDLVIVANPYGRCAVHAATCCNMLRHAATYCNTPHCQEEVHAISAKDMAKVVIVTAPHCSKLQHTATHCNYCSILQHTATHCNTLQHITTHLSIIGRSHAISAKNTVKIAGADTIDHDADQCRG